MQRAVGRAIRAGSGASQSTAAAQLCRERCTTPGACCPGSSCYLPLPAGLMGHFYAALAAGAPAASALQHAQQLVRADHPLDWAAFQLWVGSAMISHAETCSERAAALPEAIM